MQAWQGVLLLQRGRAGEARIERGAWATFLAAKGARRGREALGWRLAAGNWRSGGGLGATAAAAGHLASIPKTTCMRHAACGVENVWAAP